MSFTGNITYPGASAVRDALAACPLDALLLETDAPYLAPVPYRGKPNMPAYIVEVAKKIAHLRDVSLPELIELTTANGKRFFNIEEE